ncbi:hypothetical protein [Sorangium sp. So ce1097]|uniref:hypothetical protein n=1 Tax=Sorangium sp. So ce1097 TaxID=3133330 RepID=UPI003F63E5FB
MGEGYGRSPKLLKGALVQFSSPLLVPVPNIIIFQYNPESLTRSLTSYTPREDRGAGEGGAGGAAGQKESETSQPFDPTETFTLNLLVDATDALEVPEAHPVAVVTGVADRLAAMEMLLYPAGDSLLGGLLGSASASVGGAGASIGGAAATAPPEPPKKVPIVLFVWGPGRIVPVRIKSLNVEELQYNQLLYPHRAKVSISLQVVTSDVLANEKWWAKERPEYDIARFAYDFTRGQKEALALANVANTVDSILGMLPF